MERSNVTSPTASPGQLAKAALRRLVESRLEPTPENYAKAYHAEAGHAAAPVLPDRALQLLDRLVASADTQGAVSERQALVQAFRDGRWEQAERVLDAFSQDGSQAASLATLIERIVRGVELGGRQWTTRRRKESLQRVLEGSRRDALVLQQRLSQLVGSWEGDGVDSMAAQLDGLGPECDAADDAPGAPRLPVMVNGADPLGAAPLPDDRAEALAGWAQVAATLGASLQRAMAATELADHSTALAALTEGIAGEGASPDRVEALKRLCQRVDRALQHRQHLFDQLGGLCRELTAGLGDLAEDDSWAKGQLDAMRLKLDDGITARGVRSVSEMLRHTRERQHVLRGERGQARDALKSLINQMLQEMGELGSRTGRFHESVGRYAQEIDSAESLESLTGVVGEMLEETRNVQEIVGQTQQRMQAEHARATELSERVVALESELRRLSEEVTTDQLTQIANRRGLMQAFEVARARAERDGKSLAIGLLDVDNFKRLNDELGHSAGDVALRSLAEVVSKSLRPDDLVARYGGEEFVVLLPCTPVDEGQQILTRLQRSLSVGLFMHERKTVFVTFSAGVTVHVPGEGIEPALERADEALYEAKRTGKNRTCIA